MALTGTGWPPRRGTLRRRLSNRKWGGSRFYTNRAIEAVSRRKRITSRKRWSLFGNPGSDHFAGNLLADAGPRGHQRPRRGREHRPCLRPPRPRERPRLRYLGHLPAHPQGGRVHTFVHQLIWSNHGTGPHTHYGVHRTT